MAWEVVAQATNFQNLSSLIGELELTKGTRMRVTMNTSMPWLFDFALAEVAVRPFIPEGMDLIDVYGEGNQGIIDMEADPAWLVAILAFMAANWLRLIIAGIVISAIISFIVVAIFVTVEVVEGIKKLPMAAIAIGGGLALIGILAMTTKRKRV